MRNSCSSYVTKVCLMSWFVTPFLIIFLLLLFELSKSNHPANAFLLEDVFGVLGTILLMLMVSIPFYLIAGGLFGLIVGLVIKLRQAELIKKILLSLFTTATTFIVFTGGVPQLGNFFDHSYIVIMPYAVTLIAGIWHFDFPKWVHLQTGLQIEDHLIESSSL